MPLFLPNNGSYGKKGSYHFEIGARSGCRTPQERPMTDDEETGLEPVTIDLAPLSSFQSEIESLTQYEGLQIAGVTDYEGHQTVKEAQRACAKVRGKLEKERKRIKEPVLALARAIEEIANEAKAEIAQIETPLKHSLQAFDDEKARIERERQEVEQRRLAERVEALHAAGADWSPIGVAAMLDSEYDMQLGTALKAQKARQEAEEAEEAEKVAEQARKDAELAEAKEEALRLKKEADALQAKRDSEDDHREKKEREAAETREAEREELEQLREEKRRREDEELPPTEETPTSPDVGAPVGSDPAQADPGGVTSLPDEATAAVNLAQAQTFALGRVIELLEVAYESWPATLEPSEFMDRVSIAIAKIQTSIQAEIDSLVAVHGKVKT